MADLQKANVSKAQIIHRGLSAQPEKPAGIEKRKLPFQWVTQKKRRPSDRLFTNTLIATVLLLCVTAVRIASDQPQAHSVFQSIQQSVTLNLDEALGKLSFVSNILPEAALVFWNDSQPQTILAPVDGDIIHVFSAQEPYISMKGLIKDVHAAADGEVMSIAHGNGEEIIIRVRHPDGLETLYGNLQTCLVEEGSAVFKGDLIGETLQGDEVYFEMRRDGRAIDPTYHMTRGTDGGQ